MAGFSNYLELEVLDHVFGGADFTRPATLYLALSTTAPAEDGTNVTEPSGGNYARAPITNNNTNFPAASAGAKTLGADVTFNQASATWGTPGYWALYDANTAGNMLIYGAITTPKEILALDTPKFASGSLTITLD